MACAYGPPLTQSEIDHQRRRLSAVLLIVGGSSSVLAVLLWRYVPSLDRSVRHLVLSNADTDSPVWKILGLASGTRTCFVVVTVVGAWFAFARRDWRPAVALFLTLLLVDSGAEHLKGVFERSGPGRLTPESFPSGHASLAVLVWGYLAWFVPRALRRPFDVFWFVGSMIVLIGSVASRVALDAHWFTDVLAGVGLGASALVVAREATSVPLVRRVWVASVPRPTVTHGPADELGGKGNDDLEGKKGDDPPPWRRGAMRSRVIAAATSAVERSSRSARHSKHSSELLIADADLTRAWVGT